MGERESKWVSPLALRANCKGNAIWKRFRGTGIVCVHNILCAYTNSLFMFQRAPTIENLIYYETSPMHTAYSPTHSPNERTLKRKMKKVSLSCKTNLRSWFLVYAVVMVVMVVMVEVVGVSRLCVFCIWTELYFYWRFLIWTLILQFKHCYKSIVLVGFNNVHAASFWTKI